MAIKDKEFFEGSGLQKIAPDAWKHNKAVHLASRGGMRAWVCRHIAAPLLLVLPDQRQARDFIGDAETLQVMGRKEILPEISFSEDNVRTEAQKIQRGHILERFRIQGGVLAATPPALLAPFSSGGDSFLFKIGDVVFRDRLLTWLDQRGYERSDLVWSPGQYIFRGSIVDVFSPTDIFPIRLEFFDDEVESIRTFQPDTQKSLEKLETASIRGLTASLETDLLKFMPNDLHILYFESKELDTTAENATWLWSNLEHGRQESIQ